MSMIECQGKPRSREIIPCPNQSLPRGRAPSGGCAGYSDRRIILQVSDLLDPLSPIYWPAVYDRLGLPFHSDAVPPDRINFGPESVRLPASNVCATATNVVERPKRWILASIFGRPLFRLNLSQEGQRALFAFAADTHREMGDLIASGRTTCLAWAGRKYFQQRFQFVWSIRTLPALQLDRAYRLQLLVAGSHDLQLRDSSSTWHHATRCQRGGLARTGP